MVMFSGSSCVQLCAQPLYRARSDARCSTTCQHPAVNWGSSVCALLQGRKCESILNSSRITHCVTSLKDHHFYGGVVSLSGKPMFLF